MLSELIVQRVLDAALESGGDFAELYFEDTVSDNVLMMQGETENATYSHARGVGIRILQGLHSTYAYTTDISEEAMIRTAKAAAASLAVLPRTSALPFSRRDVRRTPLIPYAARNNDFRVELLRRGTSAAKAYSDEITRLTARIANTDTQVMIANTEGVWALDRRVRTRFAISAVASDGTQAQTGTVSPGFGKGFEAYENADIEDWGRTAAERAVTMLHAPECPAAVVPVVIGDGFGGVIFHEACGHSLEATSVSKGNSEFCGKIGQQIAAPCVTAVDDGTLDGEWGSIGVDDEGTPTRRNVLIENGILRGYMIDRLGSRRMGMPVTGSSRREGYDYAPTSRMTNTYIVAGHDNEEEMLRTMGEGLYAKTMGGGSVNPLTGEFNFAVDEGYWVRDGKIISPVRGATLIGRGSDILQKIDRVGKTVRFGQGMCGSVSGSVPTNVGQPMIRVSSITVGGRGTRL